VTVPLVSRRGLVVRPGRFVTFPGVSLRRCESRLDPRRPTRSSSRSTRSPGQAAARTELPPAPGNPPTGSSSTAATAPGHCLSACTTSRRNRGFARTRSCARRNAVEPAYATICFCLHSKQKRAAAAPCHLIPGALLRVDLAVERVEFSRASAWRLTPLDTTSLAAPRAAAPRSSTGQTSSASPTAPHRTSQLLIGDRRSKTSNAFPDLRPVVERERVAPVLLPTKTPPVSSTSLQHAISSSGSHPRRNAGKPRTRRARRWVLQPNYRACHQAPGAPGIAWIHRRHRLADQLRHNAQSVALDHQLVARK